MLSWFRGNQHSLIDKKIYFYLFNHSTWNIDKCKANQMIEYVSANFLLLKVSMATMQLMTSPEPFYFKMRINKHLERQLEWRS